MKTLKISLLLFASLYLLVGCQQPQSNTQQTATNDSLTQFSFVFATDIHIFEQRQAPDGFRHTIEQINQQNPDFVITGGDLIMDALGEPYDTATMLYQMYDSLAATFNMPVHNTIGNHEVFGWYPQSGTDSTHELYGKKMYEKHIGNRYTSFDHKGWHFMTLDGIGRKNDGYIGYIDSVQVEWIKQDLAQVAPGTPIVVSVHIPFLTVWTELNYNALQANFDGVVITNGTEVLKLFDDHNLKLVLQGHLHYFEDIYVNNTHFITAGAVSGEWWKGPHLGTQEGFLKIDVKGDEFSYQYIDSGWEAAPASSE